MIIFKQDDTLRDRADILPHCLKCVLAIRFHSQDPQKTVWMLFHFQLALHSTEPVHG